jgi:tetratricopeptide (TPR) repeat protein
VVILFLVVISAIAGRQDKYYRTDYQNYQQAIQLISQEKYDAAEKIFAQLDPGSRASYQVLYSRGYCAMKNGDYSSAADFMQKVREISPSYLANQIYLQQYGTILYHLQDYQRAKLYLLESQKYNNNPEAAAEARKYLEQIALIEKGGRE